MSVTIKFPEEICFAFNPNYIEIGGAVSDTSATITIEGETEKTFSVGLINGSAKIYVSRWMQLLFGDPIDNNRTKWINIEVKLPSEDSSHCSEHLVIWGALEPVKRFGSIGSYVYNAEEKNFTRRVRWFKNYPFTLSLFALDGTTFQVRFDGNGYGNTSTIHTDGYSDLNIASMFPNAKRKIVYKINGSTLGSTFDDTYDYTFKELAESASLVRISVDDAKGGYYFRWIDELGQYQYYLFRPNNNSVKVKNGDAVDADIYYGDMYYGGGQRYVKNEKIKTVKCGACCLNEDEAEYVRSIAYSVFVDLYLGKDRDEDPIWIPCKVADGTFSISEKEGMQDFEITVEVPTSQSQSV